MGIREDLAAFIAEARTSQMHWDDFVIGLVERLGEWAEGVERRLTPPPPPPPPAEREP